MTTSALGSLLAAGLWMLAGVLAWVAVGVRYARRGEMNWGIAAAGLFFFAAGLSAWFRARQVAPPDAVNDPSHPPRT